MKTLSITMYLFDVGNVSEVVGCVRSACRAGGNEPLLGEDVVFQYKKPYLVVKFSGELYDAPGFDEFVQGELLERGFDAKWWGRR